MVNSHLPSHRGNFFGINSGNCRSFPTLFLAFIEPTNYRENFLIIFRFFSDFFGFFQALKYFDYVSICAHFAQPLQIWIVGPCPPHCSCSTQNKGSYVGHGCYIYICSPGQTATFTLFPLTPRLENLAVLDNTTFTKTGLQLCQDHSAQLQILSVWVSVLLAQPVSPSNNCKTH